MKLIADEYKDHLVLIFEPEDLEHLRAGEMLTKVFGRYRPSRVSIGYSANLPELMPRFERGELTMHQLIEAL